MKIEIIPFFCALLFHVFLLSCGSLSAEVLQSDQDLFNEPLPTAAVAGKARKGDVAVLEKKGFWVKIKSGSSIGWVKRSFVSSDSSSKGLEFIDTGRLASGNIVATSGVRGLDRNDLINARADFSEFQQLEEQRVSAAEAAAFAREAGLITRDIQYIESSSVTNEAPEPDEKHF